MARSCQLWHEGIFTQSVRHPAAAISNDGGRFVWETRRAAETLCED
jgi:hypothetical protein